jgi:hypothetical protein
MHQVIVLLDEVCLGRERMTGAIEIGGHMRLVRWLPLLIALVIFSTYGALQIASKTRVWTDCGWVFRDFKDLRHQ